MFSQRGEGILSRNYARAFVWRDTTEQSVVAYVCVSANSASGFTEIMHHVHQKLEDDPSAISKAISQAGKVMRYLVK